MRHWADDIVAGLGIKQCGCFAAWQLDDAKVPDEVRKRRRRSGAWIRHLPGVYGLPGVPPSFEQRVWIAKLAIGRLAVVSHETAAEILEIPNVIRGRLTLTVPHSGYQRLPGITVHQISDILPWHLCDVRGLPVTTVARTLVDLSPWVHPARLPHIVEEAKHGRLVTYAEIGECLKSVARRGKPGVRRLARVLDQLDNERAVAGSVLELALLKVIDRARLARPRPQFPFPGRLFTKGCVDFAYVEAKLIIEVDGRSWHTRIKDLKRDHERDADAARHGWDTLRFYYEHIVSDPEGTAETIAEVRSQRLALLGR